MTSASGDRHFRRPRGRLREGQLQTTEEFDRGPQAQDDGHGDQENQERNRQHETSNRTASSVR